MPSWWVRPRGRELWTFIVLGKLTLSNCENRGVGKIFTLFKMPPKHRSKAQSSKDQSASTSKESSDDEHSKSAHAMEEELRRRQKKKKEVKWSPVFKRMGYFALLFIVPAILNYAALNQERGVLIPQGWSIKLIIFICNEYSWFAGAQLYDVGWGQKLLLQCMGKGLPTGRETMDIFNTVSLIHVYWSVLYRFFSSYLRSSHWAELWYLDLDSANPCWAHQGYLLAAHTYTYIRIHTYIHTQVCVYDRAGLGFSDRAYAVSSINYQKSYQWCVIHTILFSEHFWICKWFQWCCQRQRQDSTINCRKVTITHNDICSPTLSLPWLQDGGWSTQTVNVCQQPV